MASRGYVLNWIHGCFIYKISENIPVSFSVFQPEVKGVNISGLRFARSTAGLIDKVVIFATSEPKEIPVLP